MIRALFAALVLSGCSSTIQRVEIPVPVPCVTDRPAPPVLPDVPPSGIFDQVKSLIVRDKLQAAHIQAQDAVIEACRR